MVQPTCSSSCPIGSVYYAKLGKKLLIFLKNTVKVLLGFRYLCDILFVLTLIFAHKLSFQMGKYIIQDGPKFNTIQQSDKKFNLLTIPG